MGWSRERRIEWKSNEREVLIERVTMGLERNLVLGKSQEYTRMTPAGGKDAQTGLLQ